MKKSDVMFIVFDILLALAVVSIAEKQAAGLVFIFGLMVNDLYAMYNVKYGVGKFSRVMGDFYRYFFMLVFNASFIIFFFFIPFKAAEAGAGSVVEQFLEIVSVLLILYYFPGFLSVGRYRMYIDYERKGIFKSIYGAFRASVKSSFTKNHFVFLAAFYGGLMAIAGAGKYLPERVGSFVMVLFIYFVYAIFPVMAESLYFRKRNVKRKS